MCIVSNWVNEAQDLIAVKKYDDLPNSLIPSRHTLPAAEPTCFLRQFHRCPDILS